MIVNIETAEGTREFLVPAEFHQAVWSLLTTIDAGAGENVVPRLLSRGSKPIHTIKVLRQYYGLNLKDAKRFVDLAPVKLPPLQRITAEKMIEELVREGARVELPSAIERLGALAKHELAAAKAMAKLNGE